MKILTTFIILLNLLYATNFSVGTYNVENLFDMNYDRSEYKEFRPNSKANWTEDIYQKKLKNTSFVINELDVDILALQEIENENVLKELKKLSSKYPYHMFLKNNNSAIGVGILSKYPIKNKKRLEVNTLSKYSRPILECDVEIDGKDLKLFISHWLSKRSGENYRIEYALSLQKRIKELSKDTEYIILGDLNSNYDEYLTFTKDKSLNTSYEITGINQILNTTQNGKFVTLEDINSFDKTTHYNLWLELNQFDRFSYIFKNTKQTPDNIIISSTLYDKKGIDYIKNSFNVFKPEYLYKNNKIFRWQRVKGKYIGLGYSDHLPIFAKFTTDNASKDIGTKKIIQQYNISTLYENEKIHEPIIIKNLQVVYKKDKFTLLSKKDDRSIPLYGQNNLIPSQIIDIKVNSIKSFYGQKEIDGYEIINKQDSTLSINYTDANTIDLFNPNYQNEIITNLKGYYNKGYLYFKDKKIKLYSNDKSLLPKDDTYIFINSAHLTNYRLNTQLKIYKKSDYKVIQNVD